jgi:hypothetical protein
MDAFYGAQLAQVIMNKPFIIQKEPEMGVTFTS